jgi:transketolase
VIIATGSETSIALDAQQKLAEAGIPTRVVSMPCTNVFDRQSAEYQSSVIPASLPAVAIEAAQPDFWHKYVGRAGQVIGISTFGESAPAGDLYKHFGITSEALVDAVKSQISH